MTQNNLSSPVTGGCASCGAPKTALDQDRVDTRVSAQSDTMTEIMRSAFCAPASLCMACLSLSQNMIIATGDALFSRVTPTSANAAAMNVRR